ncbi:MAG: 50S ribosomal protein L10 [Candidatus Harrisonbacteria bacterium RIFCSPLOWO2_01_FULL_40_28]|uniref:Large ribosomal subunit protein uL10 n=1 Tax=Candidatus Harrisonbacteria bacterium RIFCSPLOWO2_01_FULL_40_28 TaxID=1798406 RepID=A0A1G1ZPC1_9BACT|nr:MAG: 50S ribosomal protein L10 [Candidatus Harrisonbacteria bacterium RIFCSPLOWO2_01_FULL_40_28]
MALTKTQKTTIIEKVRNDAKNARTLCFVNFGSIGVKDLSKLRVLARSLGSHFQVIKKSLLSRVLDEAGIKMSEDVLVGQVGVVFSSAALPDIAGPIHKLFKSLAKVPQVTGAYEVDMRNFVNKTQFKAIAQLPSREVLLTQLVYILGSPIRSFMYVVGDETQGLVAKRKAQ